MENVKLPYDFPDKVMASIEKEIAKREKREEIIIYSAIFAAGAIITGAIIYISYTFGWLAKIPGWFRLDISLEISHIWVITLIISLILVSVFCYFTNKREREFTPHG